MQPPIVAECRPGKALGAVSNFSATFNWVVNFCRNLRGDELSVTVDRTDTDHPVVRMVRNDTPLAPFAVRWSDADSSLVVYLPPSSVSGEYQVMLTAATDANWYLVANGDCGADGDVVEVHAHVKDRVRTSANGSIGRVVYVAANTATVQDFDNQNAGDAWRMTIAAVGVTEVGSGASAALVREVNQLYTGAVSHLAPVVVVGLLPLHWYATLAQGSSIHTFTPYADGGEAPWSHGSVAQTALPASGSCNVYYQVDCTGNTPTASVATTRPTETYTLVFADVYQLQNGCVVADTRDVLNREVFYP